MWWVESTPNSNPNFQSTSHNLPAPAGLNGQLPVDTSVSSPDIAQKLSTHIERLEALVAKANSRFAVAKRQSAAETEVHSAIVRTLHRQHDEETAAFRKKIAELQHSQSEAAKVQKQMLVEFASRQSKAASKIEAAEYAARLASEKTDRLRREYRECLAKLDVQAKMVAQQTTQLNDLQSEKSQLLDQVTTAIGNCQQLKSELQLKNAALVDSNGRLDAIAASQSELQARLQQQQVEHRRQIAEIEQKTHQATQEQQSQYELETQALQQTISGLEQSLAQSAASQSELQARLQQQQDEHTRQIAAIEQKTHAAAQEQQSQYELETQALQQTISGLEQSLAQSAASQSELQDSLQQQLSEHTQQMAEIEQKSHLAAQEQQRQHELETQALQQTISRLEQSLEQSVASQSELQARLQQLQDEHTRQIAEVEQKTHVATAQADLEITQLRAESQADREKSASEISSLKHLVHEFEMKQSESQATLDCQTTKLREQEELLKTAISERERLAACCHELRVDGQQATERWQARLHAEFAKLEALAQQLASLEQCRSSEVVRYELDIRQLTEHHQRDCDVLRSTISELNQAHDSSQRDLWEQQRLFELREAEYNRRLQEVEQNSRSILAQSQQQRLTLRNELDQALAIHSTHEKQHAEHCAKLLADINGLTQAVADLQSRQSESQAKHAAQERLIDQRSALVESLRIKNERLSVQHRELATDHEQLREQWQRSVEQESQAQEAASALLEVEQELKGQVQAQAEQIISLQAEADNLRVTNRHQSQAHHQCAEELRAEITRSQSLLEIQNQQLIEYRGDVDVLSSTLAEAKNAQELARRDSDENARSAQKFSSQCLLLRDQLQKAAAARRKAESALIRAAELADPNSIAEITWREIETQQAVERLVVELKSTRLVCLNLKRQSSNYQQEIDRLKSELHSMTSESYN